MKKGNHELFHWWVSRKQGLQFSRQNLLCITSTVQGQAYLNVKRLTSQHACKNKVAFTKLYTKQNGELTLLGLVPLQQTIFWIKMFSAVSFQMELKADIHFSLGNSLKIIMFSGMVELITSRRDDLERSLGSRNQWLAPIAAAFLPVDEHSCQK